jgi:uncharacterized membrane protein YeaQ/YmgE (transglycosylase-associated protein family)
MFDLIGYILMGFVVGLIARALKPGNDRMGLGMTTLLGVLGSVLAGFIGRSVGWYEPQEGAGFIVSTLGAIIVLSVYYMATRRGTAGRHL